MQIDEIFDKLMGEIKCTGDDYKDEQALSNLEDAERLIFKLANALMDNAKQVSSHKSSVQKVAKKSYNMLSSLKEDIDSTILYAKKQLFKDEIQAPKITQIGALPHIYKMGVDSVISPFTIEYTLEWYNKESGEQLTLTDVSELQLFTEALTADGTKTIRKYQDDDKEIQYWEQANQTEINHLGKNVMIQPNVSRVGTIKNFYGDIYTLSTFYDALQKYKDIEDPIILCSTEW